MMGKAGKLIGKIYIAGSSPTKHWLIYLACAACATLAGSAISAFFVPGHLPRDRQQLLLACLFVGELAYLISRLRRYVHGDELPFLLKLGFSDFELFVLYVFKLRVNGVAFAASCIALHFPGGAAALPGYPAALAGSICLFAMLVFFAAACHAIICKAGTAAKLVGAAALGATAFAAIYSGSAKLPQAPSLDALLQSMADAPPLQWLAQDLMSLGGAQLCMLGLSCLTATALLRAGGWVFERNNCGGKAAARDARGARRSSPSRQHPLKCFVAKDVKGMLNNAPFVVSQILFVSLSSIFMYYGHGYAIKAMLVVSVGFNSLFVQHLFELDALQLGVYRKLPLHFWGFAKYRIAGAAAVAWCVPYAAFSAAFALQRVDLHEYAVFSAVSMCEALLLAAHFSCIVLIFFPNIRRTDIPLIAGIFLPFLMVATVPLGLAKGRKGWGRWE